MPKLYPRIFNEISWSVGSLIAHDKFIIDLTSKCYELEAPKPIDYVFGSIPCKWQGGRLAPRNADFNIIEELIIRHSHLGIGCRFTFSRYDISEDDLGDRVCNRILDLLNKYSTDEAKHGVIVSSELLAEYIKRRYPKLQIVISIIKSINEIDSETDIVEYYSELTSKYDIVVMNSDYVFDLDLMSKIRDKSKIEILANHRCIINCPLAKRHYEIQCIIEQQGLNGESSEKEIEELNRINKSCYNLRLSNPLNSCILDMYTIQKLVDMGYSNFKLEGRDYDSLTIIRDIGSWIFNSQGPYLALAQSIIQQPV